MTPALNWGDHSWWNGEVGRVSGTILRNFALPIEFKGYLYDAFERVNRGLFWPGNPDQRHVITELPQAGRL